MTTSQIVETNQQFFSSTLFNALAEAMTEACGSPWLVAAMPDAEAKPDEAEPVRIKMTLDGTLEGEFLLEFQRGEAAMLAAKILRQPIGEIGSKQLETLVEMVNGSRGRFQRALEQEYGTLRIACASDSGPSRDRANGLEATLGDDSAHRLSVRMYLNPALTDALSRHSQREKTVGDSAQSAEAGSRKAASEGVNLEMIMDVELNVTLRFGQRQLTLREVLDLTSGSVIELDRQVDEPVELLLDGVVIAKGEAVVVDGNYGLRVIEVTRPVSTAMLARA
jgi:flagellar motor switch protein FliN/FliY